MEGQKPNCPYPEPPPPYSQDPMTANPGYAPSHQQGKGYPPPPPGSQTVIMGPPPQGQVGSVTVVSVAQWGPYPMQVGCPHCGAQVMTETRASPGLLTWLLAGALIFFGCWLGCCLIPCCIPECQDIEHRCPNCKQHLGSYRRL